MYIRDRLADRAKKKTILFSYLGGQCNYCSSKSDLEFDHIDYKTKSFTIGRNIFLNQEELYRELDKCQLLCSPCHKKKTATEGSKRGNLHLPRHGTPSMYNNRGCRCTECRQAWTVYFVAWRNRNKPYTS